MARRAERWAVLALIIVLPAAELPAQEVKWRHDLPAAREEAKQVGRPILFDFGYEGCVWCKKLDATTFRDPAVVKLLNEQFVPVKIDAQRDAELTKQHHVEEFPTLLAIAPDGKVLARQDDYADVPRMKQFLSEALAKLPAGPAVGRRTNRGRSIAGSPRTAAEKQERARELLRLARAGLRRTVLHGLPGAVPGGNEQLPQPGRSRTGAPSGAEDHRGSRYVAARLRSTERQPGRTVSSPGRGAAQTW